MKKALNALKALAAISASVAGLDLTGILPLLPEGWSTYVLLIPTIGAAVVHTASVIGDYMDDGKKNDTFTYGVLLMVGLSCLFTSCSVSSYTVDGSKYDWYGSPIQQVDAEDVTPNFTITIPENLPIDLPPVTIEATK